MADQLQLFVSLGFALRPEKSVGWCKIDIVLGELAGKAERKIRWHSRAFYSAFAEKMGKHFFIRRRLLRFALHFSLKLVQRNELVDLRRPAAAVHFQIAQNDRALSVLLEKNKRIARPELCRIKHVRVDVAGRDDQSCSILSFCHGCCKL